MAGGVQASYMGDDACYRKPKINFLCFLEPRPVDVYGVSPMKSHCYGTQWVFKYCISPDVPS